MACLIDLASERLTQSYFDTFQAVKLFRYIARPKVGIRKQKFQRDQTETGALKLWRVPMNCYYVKWRGCCS
ncbi:AFH_G0001070.mRNA.1.CDS.1 [Saccharomyces cerevisiae]|nr:BMC_2a_G0001110.mRNA.1.CDS.1 [Saccharomyces cerevisiae]CAI4242419.1 BAQ_1a_G0001020.mRNA.1.CDS.1 [Saccharomyces cerevisiae]CAI4242958.1 BMB_G0001110.mRNA.1.CDS.1 [Saccharomyces cerevisiae]CAI4244084.1 BAM_G0001010.mRNA.1.CDS.1 [Saccharomyces cerevisiae]CAI4245036.1 BAP_1a_G0001040.mRNA.1.CDS.1 [Saccharomyces cerevisiae]